MSEDLSPGFPPDLRQQLDLYTGLFAELPVPATLIDLQGIILDVNQAFLDYARLHASPVLPEDRIGRPIAAFATRPEDRQLLEPLLERIFATGEADQITWRKPDRQGQLFYVELRGIPLKNASGQLIGAALLRRDVTTERRQQQRQTTLAELLGEVWAMRHSNDIEQVLSSIYSGLCELGVSFDACGISLIDAKADPPSVRCCNISHQGHWVEETTQPESVAALLEIWKTQSVNYRKDLHGEDAFGEGDHLENAFARPVRSVVDVPFTHGTLALNSARAHAFSAEDIEVLQEMAAILSSGFARMDDFQKLEKRTRELEEEVAERQRRELHQRAHTQVRDAIWQMRNVGETDRLLDAFAAALKTVEIPFFSFGINLVDASGEAPVVRFYNAGSKEWSIETNDRARDAVLKFWHDSDPVYRPDLNRDDPYQERDTIDGAFGTSVRSVVDVPFSHGTLAVNSLQPNAFSQSDIAFLQELASVLGEGFRRLEDIEKMQDQEKQLLQSQKMEVVGRLAGGVAHDFNNMLTAILGAGTQLLQECAPDDPQRLELELIQDAGQKAANLTRQLLAFSRQQVLQPRVLDLNELIAGQVKMVQRLIGEDVELSTRFDPHLDRVEVDPNQIVQVLLNLVVNARDAMPAGGQLTIDTRNVELNSDSPTRQEPPGSYVQLSVSDSGQGMDPETLEHIFEPFFTTKECRMSSN